MSMSSALDDMFDIREIEAPSSTFIDFYDATVKFIKAALYCWGSRKK